MKIPKHSLFSIIAFLLLASCDKPGIPFFRMSIPPDPCDPASSLYEDGNHYIDRDMINQEGQIEPSKLFEILDPANNPCDALNKKD